MDLVEVWLIIVSSNSPEFLYLLFSKTVHCISASPKQSLRWKHIDSTVVNCFTANKMKEIIWDYLETMNHWGPRGQRESNGQCPLIKHDFTNDKLQFGDNLWSSYGKWCNVKNKNIIIWLCALLNCYISD